MILLKLFNRGVYLGLSPPHGQYIQSKVFLQERSRGNFEMTHKDREEGGGNGMTEGEDGLMYKPKGACSLQSWRRIGTDFLDSL